MTRWRVEYRSGRYGTVMSTSMKGARRIAQLLWPDDEVTSVWKWKP